ncbi:LONG-CHAIN-ALCOHOL O-FATTY-ACYLTRANSFERASE 3-RELATED [Salix koriyanagi]|uniref:LONG-CHAIN-ALCOHOL O-FATTY-ACYLTRANSFERASE 3-RELATED n=1 Tax=Salix koriyanagi TaxID=2511006 RepID=A0A9Q0TQT6_9ROSI|nr:LONG-CHAIN-ALCOHOL O-FATTY-ACYLTRANSFERASE 3-RELATED [Salix koriyanagi]
MEGEILNFIKVWITVLISLCFCYSIRNTVPKGTKRFLSVLPVVCLFLYLPLKISSVHLGGSTAFFVAWLANFKILLFAFGKGPLSSDPSISLPLFIALACLPIKIQQKRKNKETPSPEPRLDRQSKENPAPGRGKEGLRSYAIKAVGAVLARNLLGLELEPQFNEPYFATSLQDFWGCRWNLVVTSILRPTVYEPIRSIGSHLVGRKWAPLPAVFATFVVSAMMHELIFFYLGRVRPNWEISWFFLLHGFLFNGRDCNKEGLERQVAAAENDLDNINGRVYHEHRLLAVLPQVCRVQGRC